MNPDCFRLVVREVWLLKIVALEFMDQSTIILRDLAIIFLYMQILNTTKFPTSLTVLPKRQYSITTRLLTLLQSTDLRCLQVCLYLCICVCLLLHSIIMCQAHVSTAIEKILKRTVPVPQGSLVLPFYKDSSFSPIPYPLQSLISSSFVKFCHFRNVIYIELYSM